MFEFSGRVALVTGAVSGIGLGGFPIDPAVTEAFGGMMDIGMDPQEVGRKLVEGIRANRPVIFSHPEFRDEIAEECDLLVPPARLAIEERRRAGKQSGNRLVSPH